MKIFSVAMALIIAIFIGGTASAATWEVVDRDGDTVTSIDKDSIRRGTDSKKFPKFNRKDGYSAIIKIDVKFKDDNVSITSLVSFYEKNGQRMFCVLDGYDGTNYPAKDSDVEEESADRDGVVWKKVWAYIEANLK